MSLIIKRPETASTECTKTDPLKRTSHVQLAGRIDRTGECQTAPVKFNSRLPRDTFNATDIGILPQRLIDKVSRRVGDIKMKLPHTGTPKK